MSWKFDKKIDETSMAFFSEPLKFSWRKFEGSASKFAKATRKRIFQL
jgi:hypothetical protein